MAEDKDHSQETTPAPAPSRRHILMGVGAGVLIGAGGGFGGGYYYANSRKPRRRPRKPTPPAKITLAPGAPRLGPDPAKVTMVIFTDFQCPFCRKVLSSVEKLRGDHKDDLAVLLRHHPLDFHKDAPRAARAFEAAARQDKAWPMHDILFEHQKALNEDAIHGYAGQIGLDVDKFKADLADPAIAKQVDDDIAYAKKVGVRGTPTSFINGQAVRGARPVEDFEAVVKTELAEAEKLIAAGTPLAQVYEKRCDANIAAFGKKKS